MDKIKTIIKLFTSPIVLKFFKIFRKDIIRFRKTNLSWEAAHDKTSKGYFSGNILNKCKDSLLKVKKGEYPYERDSVLFSEKEIFYPLLSSLFYVALKNEKKLNIIDFGGSLGSTYFQNKDILKQAGIIINWNIIEQENFVKCGKEYFSDNELHFFNSIDEINNNVISAVLFSSVLPYLKEPYTILDYVMKYDINYILIDRTVFLDDETEDILTIQNVPAEIYTASYPAWFLSLSKFLDFAKKKYNIIFKWNSLDQYTLKNYKTTGHGFLLKKH